jgi:hypothetical protein
MKRKTKLIAASVLAATLALGAGAASAMAAVYNGGAVSCANRVTLWSNGTGTQYHELSGVPLATYPSTTTAVTRISTRNLASESSWYVAISNVGNYGYPRCN